MQSTRSFLFVLIASLKCEHRDGENPPIYSGAGRLKQRVERRKIRLIEGNAKCCHLKKLTSKGTAAGVYLPRTPYPPPSYTLYKCIQNAYCAAKAIFYCPSMNSHRPRSQNISKESTILRKIQEEKDPDRM
jgi:hypothetical protein